MSVSTEARMRHPVDTGTIPARPPRRHRLRRLLLIAFGLTSAAFAYDKFLPAGPTEPAGVDSAAPSSPRSAALTSSEPIKKRSFTEKRPAEGTGATVEWKPVRVEAAPPQAAATLAVPVTPPEPVTTGALRDVSRNPDGVDRDASTARKRPVGRDMNSSAADRRGVELPQRKQLRREVRSIIVAQPASGHSSSSATAAPRRQRSAPRRVLATGHAERAITTAPRKTASLCLYFVLCF
jgi:hypothetical protein